MAKDFYSYSKKDLKTIRNNRQRELNSAFQKPMNWKEKTYAFFHGGKLYKPNGGASGGRHKLNSKPPHKSRHNVGRVGHSLRQSQGSFLSRPKLLGNGIINKF